MSQTFTMDDLKRMLQERQHKMTPQRQVVLQIFLDHPGEPFCLQLRWRE